jgi:hypothetical protein
MVFSQSSGKQAVSFCKVRFFLACALFGKVRFLKLATFFSENVSVSLVQVFSQVHFFWQVCFLAKSVFSKGFGKSSALAFW